jgi:NADH-quinone oxidoreductase subunit C
MQAVEWDGTLPARLRAEFTALTMEFKSYLGQNFVQVPVHAVRDVVRFLRDREHFDMLTDLTCVDRPTDPERFEIVCILYSFASNERMRVKARVALDAEVPSIVAVFVAADWLEREVFDMFGVRFSDHPDLKRILMPEDWNGFPLRKEVSITGMDNDWVERNLGIESGQS